MTKQQRYRSKEQVQVEASIRLETIATLNEPVAVEMSADEYKAMIELAKTLVLMSVKCWILIKTKSFNCSSFFF
jgi:PHD/YefM family antitoxin component YafN of YafNO toxin-antitoxin module